MKQITKKPRSKRALRLLAGLFVLLGLGWIFHGMVLGPLLREGLGLLAGQAGYQVEMGRVDARLGHPWVFSEISAIPTEENISESSFTIDSLQIEFSSLWKMFGSEARLLQQVTIQNGRISIDARADSQSPDAPMQRTNDEEKLRRSQQLLWALPRTIQVESLTVQVTGDDWDLSIDELSVLFDESSLGTLSAKSLQAEFQEVEQGFGPLEAVTAWKNGEAFLADLMLAEDIQIETLSFHLTRPGGIGFEIAAGIFGGLIRGGAVMGESRGQPELDASFWASGLNFSDIGQLLALNSQAAGVLTDGRLNFRGNPARIMDAEISLLCVASDVRWGDRGWNSLEVAASLINRRLSLSELTLQQEENQVSANGEVAVSGDWRDVTDSPFLLNVSASIKDMGSLAGLLGEPFEEMTGRMTLRTSLSGRARKVSGFLTMEASQVGFRGRSVESARLEVAFKSGEARIDKLEVWSGGDILTGKGAVAIEHPHAYTGELTLNIADFGIYDWIPVDPWPILSGSLNLDWSGDGIVSAHSGAFVCSIENLVSKQTPEGISGEFSGTYSPGNMYFGAISLVRGDLSLTAKATLAASGINIEELQLMAQESPLASGEIFLPMNPFALAQGIPPQEAIIEGKEFFAGLRTKGELQLSDLFALLGQDATHTGRVQADMQASGPVDDITGEAVIRARDLLPTENDGSAPMSLNLDVNAKDGIAKAQGELTPDGLPPIALSAEIPFGLEISEEGQFVFPDPTQKISARMEFPETDLQSLLSFLPELNRLDGTFSSEIEVLGSVSDPDFRGFIRLKGGTFQTAPRTPEITDVEMTARFQGSRLAIENFTGKVSAGTFEISGGVSLEDLTNPGYDLSLTGDKLLIFRSPDARIRANTNITLRGDNSGGEVAGEIRLVDGRIFKRLEITPLIAPLPRERDRGFTPPDFRDQVPPPFGLWKLNVRITNETPLTLVGNIASGTIEPDLTLGGSLGDPVPRGSVFLKQTRAYLPFTTLEIDEGRIDFSTSDPWMPYLDVRGHAETMDYEIQVYAFGALSDRNFVMRSEPPLSQESIILLLGTGMPPSEQSGAGFGEAAAGQGGLLLLRTFLRQFEWKGVDTESLLNRIQITSRPSNLPDGQTSIGGSVRLWDGFSLVTEQDELGFYNVGATYRFRFR